MMLKVLELLLVISIYLMTLSTDQGKGVRSSANKYTVNLISLQDADEGKGVGASATNFPAYSLNQSDADEEKGVGA